MNIIFIDSSSDIMKLAYYNTETDDFNEIINNKIDRTKDYLVNTLKQLLYTSNIELSDINTFVCITGPGSFTGIRMSLAFIEGLISGLKLINISINVIPLTLFQAYFISHINNISNTGKSIVQIPSNKINTMFIQEFDNHTYTSLSPAKEIEINNLKTNDIIIKGSSDYSVKSVLKYISKNLIHFITNQNITPCYIRPHYGIPKEYIVSYDNSKNLKKIIISNEEKQIGFIEYQISDKVAEIVNFQIEFAYRGIGAGKFLLQKFISFLKSQAFSKVLLDVRSKNMIAQNLYKKFGFVIDGVRKNYYPKTTSQNSDDAILMSLTF